MTFPIFSCLPAIIILSSSCCCFLLFLFSHFFILLLLVTIRCFSFNYRDFRLDFCKGKMGEKINVHWLGVFRCCFLCLSSLSTIFHEITSWVEFSCLRKSYHVSKNFQFNTRNFPRFIINLRLSYDFALINDFQFIRNFSNNKLIQRVNDFIFIKM